MEPEEWNRITRHLSEEAQVPSSTPVRELCELEATYGQVWDGLAFARDFDAIAFSAPRVIVVRRADGVKGTVAYQHDPRFYWGFIPA